MCEQRIHHTLCVRCKEESYYHDRILDSPVVRLAPCPEAEKAGRPCEPRSQTPSDSPVLEYPSVRGKFTKELVCHCCWGSDILGGPGGLLERAKVAFEGVEVITGWHVRQVDSMRRWIPVCSDLQEELGDGKGFNEKYPAAVARMEKEQAAAAAAAEKQKKGKGKARDNGKDKGKQKA